MTQAYGEHKARNIKVHAKTAGGGNGRLLAEAAKLSLGYGDTPLFEGINFQLREGERIRLHGRNGAGKSTLVRTLLTKAHEETPAATIFAGSIAVERDIRIGVYEQEVSASLLHMPLSAAIEPVYMAKDLPIPDQKIKQLLSDYLFDPQTDGAGRGRPAERWSKSTVAAHRHAGWRAAGAGARRTD